MFIIQTYTCGQWKAPSHFGTVAWPTLKQAMDAVARQRALWPVGTFRIVHKPL